jgi:hypothetical protein
VYAPGFSSVSKPKRDGAVQFAELLERVAQVNPEMRVRFTSPHPKDFTDDVLQVTLCCSRGFGGRFVCQGCDGDCSTPFEAAGLSNSTLGRSGVGFCPCCRHWVACLTCPVVVLVSSLRLR